MNQHQQRAQAKRERKAAKRSRDAELTRLGHELSRLMEPHVYDIRRTSMRWDERAMRRWKRTMRRRGVRQWWKVNTRALACPRSRAPRRRMRALQCGEPFRRAVFGSDAVFEQWDSATQRWVEIDP